jgi:hypothetical protein
MWDDIIIGDGNSGCSAYRIFKVEGEHSMSQNSVSFWLSDVFLGIGMTIFKDTEEGKVLTKMIEEKESWGQIKKFLIVLIIKNIKPEILIEKIESEKEKSFLEGRESKREEIEKVLFQRG